MSPPTASIGNEPTRVTRRLLNIVRPTCSNYMSMISSMFIFLSLLTLRVGPVTPCATCHHVLGWNLFKDDVHEPNHTPIYNIRWNGCRPITPHHCPSFRKRWGVHVNMMCHMHSCKGQGWHGFKLLDLHCSIM